MTQDFTDAEFLMHSTLTLDPSDFISLLVKDGVNSPFELLGSDPGGIAIGDRLVIGKIPGPLGSPDYGDIEVLAEGLVPNNGPDTKWLVTIQVSIQQQPPNP